MSHPLDQLLQSTTHSSDASLQHYGVKGMKWDEKKAVEEYKHDDSKDSSSSAPAMREQRTKLMAELDGGKFKGTPAEAKAKEATIRSLNAKLKTVTAEARVKTLTAIETVKRKKVNEYGYEKKKSKLSMGINRLKGKLNLSVRSFKNAKSTAWKATSVKAKQIGKFMDGLFGR